MESKMGRKYALSRGGRLAAMGMACLLLFACAGNAASVKPTSPAPSPLPAPFSGPPSAAESWRSLRLRLNPPLDTADSLARELTFALETALVQAGLQMVRDPAAPVDAHLDLASAFHSVGFAIHGTAFLAVEGDGVLIDQVTTSDGFYRRDRFAQEAAHELLLAFLASSRVATFASHHGVIPIRMIAAAPTVARSF
jgi:hypothetical protein